MITYPSLQWNASYLIETYGDLNVRTERAVEDRAAGSQKGGMSLADLISRGASGEDVYAISNVRRMPSFDRHSNTHTPVPASERPIERLCWRLALCCYTLVPLHLVPSCRCQTP